jgi:hypothetical protein
MSAYTSAPPAKIGKIVATPLSSPFPQELHICALTFSTAATYPRAALFECRLHQLRLLLYKPLGVALGERSSPRIE